MENLEQTCSTTNELRNISIKARLIADRLRSGAVSGNYILENMNSKEWYAPFVLFSRHLDQWDLLLDVSEQLIKHGFSSYSIKKSINNPVFISLGYDNEIAYSRFSSTEDNLAKLAIYQHHGKVKSDITIPSIIIDGGKMVGFLQWGGVHHGSSGFFKLVALGNALKIAYALSTWNHAVIVSNLTDEFDAGTLPVIAAIAAALGISTTVVTHSLFSFQKSHLPQKTLMSLFNTIDILEYITDKMILIKADDLLKVKEARISIADAFKQLDAAVAAEGINQLKSIG